MAKGYVVACVTVLDPVAYAQYSKASAEALKKHGGRALARGGQMVELEGTTRPRNVILEFDSLEAAKRYYTSAEYQAAKAKREGVAVADIFAVEGGE